LDPSLPIIKDTMWRKLPIPEWVDDPRRMLQICRMIRDRRICAVDTETTGLDISRDHVLFWSLCSDLGERFCLDPEMLEIFSKELGNNPSITWVMTNANYDNNILANSGVPLLAGPIHCTLVMDWLYDENKRHGLKEAAKRYLHLNMEEFKSTFRKSRNETYQDTLLRIMQEKPQVAIDYASLDAWASLAVHRYLKDKLEHIPTLYGYSMWDLFNKVEVPYSKVLYHCERRGVMIDIGYLRELEGPIQRDMERISKRFNQLAGIEVNIGSPTQLRRLFFEDMERAPLTMTKGGESRNVKPQLNENVLAAWAQDGCEFSKMILEWRDLQKTEGTYIKGMVERADSHCRIHPTLNQHVTVTGRLCVAAGTKIQMPCDRNKFPNGKPIEAVQKGDLVYSYDRRGGLHLKKVLWAGQTGTKKTVRIKWQGSGRKHTGELLLTPDHEVRLISGDWVRAKDLKPKDRVLSLHAGVKQSYGYCHLYPRLGKEIRENVFVGRALGMSGEVIHHKDEDKLNNCPSNLEGQTKVYHSRYHGTHCSEELKQFRTSVLLRPDVRAKAVVSASMRVGPLNSSWKEIPRSTLLKWAAVCKGQIKKIIQLSGVDFNVLQREYKRTGLDLKAIRKRYGADGKFISRRRLLDASLLPQPYCYESLSVGFYTYKKLLECYGLVNNHEILSVEPGPVLPVYDLEVEDTHAFVANEICVHNSSRNPNLQNIRNPEDDPYNIRGAFMPGQGYDLVCADYRQLEMRIMADLSGDENMRDVIRRGWDIHMGTASLMYNVPYEEIVRAKKEGGRLEKEEVPKGEWPEWIHELLGYRRTSKTIGFGLNYSKGTRALAADLGISYEEAEEKIKKYFEPYPRVQAFIEEIHKFTRHNLEAYTYLGRIRRLTDADADWREGYFNPRDKKWVPERPGRLAARALRQDVNSRIQGGAADVARLAQLRLEGGGDWESRESERLRDLGVRQILQIHDEIMMEVPPENLEEAIPLITTLMENPFEPVPDILKGFPFRGLSIPLGVDIGHGESWTEAH